MFKKDSLHIVIAEKSDIIYRGLYRILIESDLNCSIARATNFNELLGLTQKRELDLALINPAIIVNNLSQFKSLKQSAPAMHYIGIIFAYYETEILSEFSGAINIYDSGKTIEDLIHNTINEDSSSEPGPSAVNLSEREIDVLKLLVQGDSNKVIAEKLFLSIHTVNTHRKNIIHKTGIKSVAGLTIYAVLQNIITLENVE